LVWVLMSDGEFQEGQTWETLLTAAFHRLDNLRVYVDVNNQQVDGKMGEVMAIEPFLQKVAAFGWAVRRADGHDLKALAQGAREGAKGLPWMTLAYTCPFKGLEPLSRRGSKLHYIRIKDREESRELLQHLEQSRASAHAAA
jgi:transketolase